jgi:hypothetical protein
VKYWGSAHPGEKGIDNECTYLRERRTHMPLAATGSDSILPITTLTPALIREIVKWIVAVVHPDQIILFGSYACGTPHKEWEDRHAITQTIQ